MSKVRPIETEYKGCRFRSRLEARWAVVFENMGIQWKYECQGYENRDGYRYLPDFWVKFKSNEEYFVEVKGDREYVRNNKEHLDRMHDFGGVLPNFDECADNIRFKNGLIFLGEIPQLNHGILLVPVIGHHEAVIVKYFGLGRSFSLIDMGDSSYLFHRSAFSMGEHIECWDGDFQPVPLETKYACRNFCNAVDRAKKARFEHGDRP